MTTKAINNHIRIRKSLLNFLLIFLCPTNRFIVSLSQNLDMLVAKRQRILYIRHKNKHSKSKSNSNSKSNPNSKSNQQLDNYVKIA